MATTTHQATTCFNCGYGFAMATCLTSQTAGPKPGDFTLCVNCGAFLAFGADLIPREPTLAQILSFTGRGRAIAEAAQRIIQKRGRIP